MPYWSRQRPAPPLWDWTPLVILYFRACGIFYRFPQSLYHLELTQMVCRLEFNWLHAGAMISACSTLPAGSTTPILKARGPRRSTRDPEAPGPTPSIQIRKLKWTQGQQCENAHGKRNREKMAELRSAKELDIFSHLFPPLQYALPSSGRAYGIRFSVMRHTL